MKYTIRRAYEWLFPDDICDRPDCSEPIVMDLPRNCSDAIQILTDIPWRDFQSVEIESACGNADIVGTPFALLPVWVDKNTGQLGYTAFPEENMAHVSRVAPFYVYDVIAPLEDRTHSLHQEKSAFYFRFDVTDTCVPGYYTCTVRILSKLQQKITIPICLCIHSSRIPDQISLKTSNWFNLQNIALRHDCKLWSDKFWEMTEQYAALMERAHQNCFLLPFAAIACHQEKGSWQFDFDHAKRFIEIFARHGMQLLEWGPVVRQLFLGDKNFRLLVDERVLAVSDEGMLFIEAFYRALYQFLQEKGYLAICVFHVADEPFDTSIEEYEQLAARIKQIIPAAKLMDAVCTSKIADYPDIPIPDEKRYEEDYPVFQEIQRQRQVWYYTCSLPGGQYCNRLLDIPLIKTRMMYWGAVKYGLSGYLHWGFNCYRVGQNPYTNLCPKFTAVHEEKYLPAGDTHLVYPGRNGPLSSVRLEQIRKGIEDYALFTQAFALGHTDTQKILDRGMSGFSDVCTAKEFHQIYQDLLNLMD